MYTIRDNIPFDALFRSRIVRVGMGEEAEPIVIVCDSREPDSLVGRIREHLSGRQTEYEIREEELPVGDFIVDDLIIERKGASDFVGRMADNANDLFFQLNRLQIAADAHYEDLRTQLLLEGSFSSAVKYSDMHKAYIMSEYANVNKILTGGVSHTPNKYFTAYYVKSCASPVMPIDERPLRDPPTVPEGEFPRRVIESFDKVGPSTAKSILEHFGTPKAVLNASEEELLEVKGIGPATASHIHSTANQLYE